MEPNITPEEDVEVVDPEFVTTPAPESEGKPVGPATIVQDDTIADQFPPAHDEAA